MKFAIAGKVYDALDLDEIRLSDILLFEKQVKEFGLDLTWDQVTTWTEEIDALKTQAEKAKHPGGLYLMAVTIWASRRLAGEPLTFEQAVNFPMSDLVNIPDPADHKRPANPTKAAPRRTGSGRGAAARRPAGAAGKAGAKTSGAASTAG